MKYHLKKGQFSVYLKYPIVGESMGAEAFEVEELNDNLIISFKIKPVDSNQKMDEDHIHEMELLSVAIYDDLIISRLKEFIKAKSFSALRMDIISRQKCFAFDVVEDMTTTNGLKFNTKSI